MDKHEWLDVVEHYIAECRAASTAPRASELALRLQLSPVQLERAFRASVGANVGHFMKEMQLERAKALLQTTDLPASAIALDAGFGTARSLFRAFRRCTGTTPGRYRGEKNVSGQR